MNSIVTFLMGLDVRVDVSAAVVCVPRPAVGRLWGPETPLWFKRSFITWDRTGSLLKCIICTLLPSFWQESLGWKWKALEKETLFPWRSLCFYSLHPKSLQESSFPPFTHPQIKDGWRRVFSQWGQLVTSLQKGSSTKPKSEWRLEPSFQTSLNLLALYRDVGYRGIFKQSNQTVSCRQVPWLRPDEKKKQNKSGLLHSYENW